MRAGAALLRLTHSRGIALIAGLLLMASMVLLALAVATGMLLEQRMAGNFADGQLAVQRAQLAGQWADYWLLSQEQDPFAADCADNCGPTPPVFEAGNLPTYPEFESVAWWRANSAGAGADPSGGAPRMDYSLDGVEEPFWLIEALHMEPLEGFTQEPGDPEPQLGYYRILARGSGRYPGSVAVTESVIARPWAVDFEPAAFPPNPAGPGFCEQVPEEVPCGRLAWRRRQ